MKIELRKLGADSGNGYGTVASLHTGSVDRIDVIVRPDLDANTACMMAARELRTAAKRFDLLAMQADPYAAATQAGINRRKVPGAD